MIDEGFVHLPLDPDTGMPFLEDVDPVDGRNLLDPGMRWGGLLRDVQWPDLMIDVQVAGQEFMEQAVDEARRSNSPGLERMKQALKSAGSEDDWPLPGCPLIGVVIVRPDGERINFHVGDGDDPRSILALSERFASEDLQGSALYTTCEPTTAWTLSPAFPDTDAGLRALSCDWILEKGINAVVIGAPNPTNYAQGIRRLLGEGRSVQLFPPWLRRVAENLNPVPPVDENALDLEAVEYVAAPVRGLLQHLAYCDWLCCPFGEIKVVDPRIPIQAIQARTGLVGGRVSKRLGPEAANHLASIMTACRVALQAMGHPSSPYLVAQARTADIVNRFRAELMAPMEALGDLIGVASQERPQILSFIPQEGGTIDLKGRTHREPDRERLRPWGPITAAIPGADVDFDWRRGSVFMPDPVTGRNFFDNHYEWADASAHEGDGDDERYMQIAIAMMARNLHKPRNDKPCPNVGAVIVDADGTKSWSGAHDCLKPPDDQPNHAEERLFEKRLRRRNLRGATIYTTLEQCIHVRRHPHQSCCSWTIGRELKKAVIGMADPNAKIHGSGIKLLMDAGVEVALAPPRQRRAIVESNLDFIRAQLSTSRPHKIEPSARKGLLALLGTLGANGWLCSAAPEFPTFPPLDSELAIKIVSSYVDSVRGLTRSSAAVELGQIQTACRVALARLEGPVDGVDEEPRTEQRHVEVVRVVNEWRVDMMQPMKALGDMLGLDYGSRPEVQALLRSPFRNPTEVACRRFLSAYNLEHDTDHRFEKFEQHLYGKCHCSGDLEIVVDSVSPMAAKIRWSFAQREQNAPSQLRILQTGIKNLEAEMDDVIARQDFERAATLRKRVLELERAIASGVYEVEAARLVREKRADAQPAEAADTNRGDAIQKEVRFFVKDIYRQIEHAIEADIARHYRSSAKHLWLVIRIDAPPIDWRNVVDDFLQTRRPQDIGEFDQVWLLVGDQDGDHVGLVTFASS